MKSIVVGTDLAERSIKAVDEAADLAALTGGAVHLVSACAGPVVGVASAEVVGVVDHREYLGSVQRELDAIAEGLRRRSITVETHVSVGTPADALCRVAEAVVADLIVVGNRRAQGAGRVLGSVPKRVVQHACCNVMVVHTG